uniref:Sorting nexin-13 n=1 Tax=Panagrellus redivivus TaxID=6233 RepID=A0A7E4WC25_PANRE
MATFAGGSIMRLASLPTLIYLLLTFLLCSLTFGFGFVITVLVTLSLFLAGFLTTLFRDSIDRADELRTRMNRYADEFRFKQAIDDFLDDKDRLKSTSIYTEKHAMTGVPDMDLVLEQIFQFLIRDFIDPWYKNITTEPLFQESLLRTTRRSVAALSQCLKNVDWVPLITRDLIDDLASHLRLYRKAVEKIEVQKSKCMKPEDLETIFFDYELEMEKNYCRDLVSTSPQYESAYMHDIADILLYLLMPSEDFRSRPLRFIVREICVTKVLIPMFDKFSDPDYLTYLIVWLLSEIPLNTDDFMTTIDTSKNVQELEALLESIHDELNSLRAKDSGNVNTRFNVKQQINSLEYAANIIKKQMYKVANMTEEAAPAKDYGAPEVAEEAYDGPIVHLPIMVVLTNNIAVSAFVEFLSSIKSSSYIDFYLAIEGFKVSVEHQLRHLASGETIESEVYETIKEAALFMYHQYLSQEAVTRVELEESVINRFLARLRNDEPQESWFEQIQDRLVEILARDERFYPAFKKHPLYVKMLEDLGILNNDETENQDASNGQTISVDLCDDGVSSLSGASASPKKSGKSEEPPISHCGPYTTANVETLGIGQQGKQMFALYNIRVFKHDGEKSSTWNVIRRYSDFNLLNNHIQSKYRKLRSLPFPAKRTFNNLDQVFLERRCKALNNYMGTLLQPNVLHNNPGLEADVHDFLSQKKYTGGNRGFPRKVMNAMFDPILSSVKAFGTAVTQVPESNFVTKVSSELNRAANVLRSTRSVEQEDHSRVVSQLDNVDTENIPLRVMILLVDEVFGLKGRNQWFRRRLVSVLRQFVNAALGSSINRRIIETVKWLTSPEQALQYLIAFRDSIWPGGKMATHQTHRHASDVLRAKFLSRCLMLSALPDELRLFIGSSTTNTGISDISNAIRNKHLNRRLIYVIFERLLVVVFPNNHFNKVLPMLHSRSPRMHHH